LADVGGYLLPLLAGKAGIVQASGLNVEMG
jgi:hypothetical protein